MHAYAQFYARAHRLYTRVHKIVYRRVYQFYSFPNCRRIAGSARLTKLPVCYKFAGAIKNRDLLAFRAYLAGQKTV